MERRSILATIAVAIAGAWPANAFAATAPSAPQLTTAPYVSPAVFSWTPGNDPLNVSQTIMRAPGACTTPPAAGIAVRIYADNTTAQHFAVPGDGTFCFAVRATDGAGGTADSPGLTVTIDTTNPTATVAVGGFAPGGSVGGIVAVSGSAADAVSGVASSVLHVGAVGACPTGIVLGSTWDTTTVTDGSYDVCNVVTDLAGHSATAVLTVTVVNGILMAPAAVPVPMPPAVVGGAPLPVTVPAGVVVDKEAPPAPSTLSVVLPRARTRTALVPVALRWMNPRVPDLLRVVVVLNLKHPPRSLGDGTVVYRGLRTSAAFKLRPGMRGNLALFAVDRSGNVSRAARRVVSLAALIPLRPLTGSTVTAPPRLSWEAQQGTAYYNVQVYRNGKRILVDWPSRPFFRLPADLLEPGTYTWYVWPALKGKGSEPTFGEQIGHATFRFEG